MKKVMLTFTMSAIIMTVATLQAEGEVNANSINVENSVAYVEETVQDAGSVNYRLRFRLRDLHKAVILDADQIEDLQFTSNELKRRISALENAPVEQRQAQLNAIVAEHLVAVRDVVCADQYNNYLTFLNEEFSKAGLSSMMFGKLLAEK